MKFYSANKKSPRVFFKEALFRGLAPDAGLYMPETFPKSHPENQPIEKTLAPFMKITPAKLRGLCADAFSFPMPMRKIKDGLFVLELFHGPTLSFKDFGARFLARTMNHYLARSKRKLTIIVATSGDTGSAVASGFYKLDNIQVVILYPYKRISELQEQQIATFGKNITAVAVRGDFDDCQRLAKIALTDRKLQKDYNLSSANSINIGRLIPQMSYYVLGYKKFAALPKNKNQKPVFVVPSGNFGNLTAGLFVKKIGLPIKSFIAAVNKNSAVPKYLETGKLENRKAVMTLSNAMDVGIPSNFVRIIDLYKNNLSRIKKDIEIITITEKETQLTIEDNC